MAPKYYFLLFFIFFFVSFFTIAKLLTVKRISVFLAAVTVSGKTEVPESRNSSEYDETHAKLIQMDDALAADVRLPDENVNYVSHPIVGVTISVPHNILPDGNDELVRCNIYFPDGTKYEVYPERNLPDSVSTVNSLFPTCAVKFVGVRGNMSGAYEMAGLTKHFDGKTTRQWKKFLLNVIDLE